VELSICYWPNSDARTFNPAPLLSARRGTILVPEERTGEETFRARVLSELAACGVAPDNVSIQYENELQDFSVRINGAAPKLDQNQLGCVARLELGGLTISFEDGDADAKFRSAAQSVFRAKAREEAIVWLTERNLLAALPLFDPTTGDLASYANQLEEHCGLARGSILEVYSPNLLTIRRDVDFRSDALRHISHAVAASNLSDHGIAFGVLGSDAAQ
jgi:hypothetical protein